MGGGEHADVDGSGFHVTDPPNFSRLDRPEQLRLEGIGRAIADREPKKSRIAPHRDGIIGHADDELDIVIVPPGSLREVVYHAADGL